MKALHRLIRSVRSKRPQADVQAPIAPNQPFFAIGDLHGRRDLLEDLVGQIDDMAPETTIVFVGDYIDRGEDAAGVLGLLRSTEFYPRRQTICLMGNHEHMLLGFLEDPERNGPVWLRNGGLQTLASFGVGRGQGALQGSRICGARDELAAAMGEDLIGWLKARPSHWITGNVAVTHAGADPRRPIGDQELRNLIWGHRDFGAVPRPDGIWVVHGHTIVPAPKIAAGHIAIDTGAYATDRLTAAHVTRDGVAFLSSEPDPHSENFKASFKSIRKQNPHSR